VQLFLSTAETKQLKPDMPNVLGLVSFRIFPTHMGGQKGVALFYQYLQQYTNVLLAVSNDNQESKHVRIEKVLLPNKKIYLNFFRLKLLRELIVRKDIDVIIAEHSYTGWIAWRLHQSTGKPFIIHSHNIESKRFQQMNKWWWKFYQYYEGWIHRKADYNFFISEEDMLFAVQKFRLSPSKCSVITYGVEVNETTADKRVLRKQVELDESKIILMFNGTLDYEPNVEAVIALADQVEPLLRKKLSNYQIIITGNRARKKLIEKILNSKTLLYLGYVPDVDLYYRAADLFINPVSNDTGVKTKLIEAIASGCTAISTESGATGIKKEVCGTKLVTVADGDWDAFVNEIINHCNIPGTTTPQEFYNYYSWRNIAVNAFEKINELNP
jgi:glycosyltransferase involved in cell wall biosynthesis